MNNEYGTYDVIAPEYVLAGVKQNLGIKNSTEDDLYLLDLINEGAKEIRSPLSFVPAIAQLQIVDAKAKLPIGFVRFAKGNFPIRYVGQDGLIPENAPYTAPAFVNNEFFTASPFQNFSSLAPWNGMVNVVDGYIYFEGNVTEQFVKIAYLSTRLDEQGNVVIPAVAERTIKAYACWKYCLAMRERPDITQAWAIEYKMGKVGLKGKFNLLEAYERPFVEYVVNKLP